MDIENIEIPSDDSDTYIVVLCSSSLSIILLIALIMIIYFYYNNVKKYFTQFPYLDKLFNSDIIKNPIKPETELKEGTPKPILSNSTNVGKFNPSTKEQQLLLKQGVDTCISIINNGVCNNSLVRGDSSFNVTNDGNLVLKKGDVILWQSFTNKNRNTTYSLTLTNSGNLILLTDDSDIIWSNNNTQKEEKSPYSLILREDSNLVIEDNQKNVIWETGTSGGKVSSVITEKENTGYIPIKDASGFIEYKEIVPNLPKSFRLDFPMDPTDQYDVSVCVPTQILDIFTYYYWKLFNKEYRFSRLFTFYYARSDAGMDPVKNDGSSPDIIYNCIKLRGLLLEKHYQYDGTISSGPSGIKNTCSVQKYQEKPQDELLDIAKKNIPNFSMYKINGNNLNLIKSAIYNGTPVMFAILSYDSYWGTTTNTTGVISYPDKINEKKHNSAHMVSIWGWDDDKEIFHLRNSHGPNYYNKGWCTIPYRYILDSELSIGFQFFKLDPPTTDIVDDSYVNKEDWVFRKDLGCPYVNTVQKGIECYDPPPSGYDWSTPDGILIGKICPPGSNDSGTTCWYDRGVGRIPDKRPCEPGERDTPTECWIDSYGRGAGRWADLGPCPPRSHPGAANDCYAEQTDRQRQPYDNGRFPNEGEPWGKSWDKKTGPDAGCSWDRHMEGGMCFRDCPDGFFGRAHEKCWANGADSLGIMRRVTDRYQCNDDEDKNGYMCYPKCKSGYHAVGCCLCEPDNGGARVTKWLKDRQYCADDEEMKDGLCYKKCKPGFNTGVTICEFSKDLKSGNKRNLVKNCK